MERIGTVERKTRTRVFDEGHFRGHTEYLIESEAGPRPAPQAFLVHQRPGWVLPVHYHLEEQFQVVTRGSGRLGRHSVGPLTVHYSARESGYGPLVAGEEGVDYLTLRAVTDPGAWYLPEMRDRMRPGLKKRHVTVGPLPPMAPERLAALGAAETQVLVEGESGGLGAWLLRVPPLACAPAPAAAPGGGRFHIVVGGSWIGAEGEVGHLACIWHGPDDAPLAAQAGAGGLELLVLQYPAAALHAEPERHAAG